VVAILWLAHALWKMPLPPHLAGFFIFVIVSILAFRAIGLIIASSVNSMQESQVLVQLLYLPMMLLSIMPMSELPTWGQVAAQFVPAVYLQTGMQGILVRSEGLGQNASAAGALALTTVVGVIIATKLFRWDKDEKVRPAAKLWILGVLTPFFILGIWQTQTRTAIVRAKVLERDLLRQQNLLIRNARIFVGDGAVVESGSALIQRGVIRQVFNGPAPDAKALQAEAVEGAGKTLLPGLIDAHVHLAAPGTLGSPPSRDSDPRKQLLRELSAYLYSGVTSVRSAGDPVDDMLRLRAQVNSGEHLGAELYTCGPMFTAPAGHGTEYFKNLPAPIRKAAEEQTVRTPASPDEARKQVRELKARGVNCIKAILESGTAGSPFQRLDTRIFNAIAAEAHAQALPLAVHTGDARDVADAVAARVASIEHGSFRDIIPDDVFERMKAANIYYDPTLTVAETLHDIADGNMEPLELPLVQQVIPGPMLQTTRQYLLSTDGERMRARIRNYTTNPDVGRRNLLRAWQLGVTLVTGTDAGNPLVFHGPALHRELQSWVDAGIPPAVALQAATFNAARLVAANRRIGLIKPGYSANLILVDGNPLKDIKQTEAMSQVILQGERIRRSALFDQE
jgi:imidazolonepropionase-like amidohydrolase